MDRVCIKRSNGKLISMQGGGDDRPDLMEMRLNTLLINAINEGYLEEEVEVKWVTEAEHRVLMEPSVLQKKHDKAVAKLEDLDRKSIRAMREWLSKLEEPPGFIVEYETAAKAARKDL